jgi:hypothetical protein
MLAKQLWPTALTSGWRTYLVAGVAMAYGLAGWATGNMDVHTAIGFIFGGAGLGAFHHGLSTTGFNLLQQLITVILSNTTPPVATPRPVLTPTTPPSA